MGVTAVIVGAVVAAGTTAYTVSEGQKAREEAKKNQDAQAAKQDALIAEQKGKEEKSQATLDAQQRRIDSRTLYATRRAGSKSVGTSPIGVVAPPTGGGGKQLLGS